MRDGTNQDRDERRVSTETPDDELPTERAEGMCKPAHALEEEEVVTERAEFAYQHNLAPGMLDG